MKDFTVKKKAGNKCLIAIMEGPIDERMDLSKELNSFSGGLTVVCNDVTRINSVGVKNWMRFFIEMAHSRVKVIFEAMSPALVEQLNLIKNFTCGGEVISIMMPYRCEPCDNSFQVLTTIETLQKNKLAPPAVNCEKCKKEASFDEISEEYLSFLVSG